MSTMSSQVLLASNLHSRALQRDASSSRCLQGTICQAMICIICHDEIKTGEGRVYTCGHVFHGNCSTNWFTSEQTGRNTCPSCRTKLDPTKSTILYIATEVATPQPPRLKTERLELEITNLKGRVNDLLRDNRRLEVDMDVLKVQLSEANRRIESQRIASEILTAGGSISLPSDHALYDNLHPQEAIQLLKSYHNEIQETLKKNLDFQEERNILQSQILMGEANNNHLKEENKKLQGDLAFLEDIENGPSAAPLRAPTVRPFLALAGLINSPSSETRRATSGTISAPSTSTSTSMLPGGADAIADLPKADPGATNAICSRCSSRSPTTSFGITTRSRAAAYGTAPTRTAPVARTSSQQTVTHSPVRTTAFTSSARSAASAARTTASATRTTATAGRTTATAGRTTAPAARTAATAVRTTASISSHIRVSQGGTTGAARVGARGGAARNATSAAATSRGIASGSSSVTRDGLRSSLRNSIGSTSEIPAKIVRKS